MYNYFYIMGHLRKIMPWLTTQEVAKELGKTVRTIERWRENGRLLPEMRTRGNHSRYSKQQVEREKLAQELSDMML
jgi:excisionase family DNA binding protein